MGADVADGAELAAFAGEEAPVVVGFLEEPVLEEVALDVDDAAEVAALDHGAHLEDGGEEAAHVIDGEDPFGGGGCFDDLCGVAAVHAEGFFADDVFTGFEGGDGLFDVLIVRRGNVDDIDFRAGDEGFVVVVAEDVGDAPLGGSGGGAGGGTADGGDLDAETFEGFDVDWADEACADDTGAEVGEGGTHGDVDGKRCRRGRSGVEGEIVWGLRGDVCACRGERSGHDRGHEIPGYSVVFGDGGGGVGG